MAGSVAMAVAYNGGSVAWVVPTYRNARPLWRFVEQHAATVADLRRAEMTAQFDKGHLTIYTADNDVGMRGEAFDLVICDEAAQYRHETWTDVIMPTLADRNGRTMLISTPKGKNWYWQEFMRGYNKERGYASFNAPTSANPSPMIRAAYQAAKTRVSQRTFLQEWDAQFVDDGGGVFHNVRECATSTALDKAVEGHNYVIGVDWGRTNDATEFCVMDLDGKRMVHRRKLDGVSFNQQANVLETLCHAFNFAPILAELNSLGGPMVEALQQKGLPVTGFVTSNASKAQIIDSLALAFERQDLAILNDDDLIMQLQAFESKRTATGLVTFSAPDGMHDDAVIALALANHSASNSWSSY